MGATQTDNGSTLGKWILITASILGIVLLIASIWSIYRALSNPSVETADISSPHDSVAPANKTVTMNTLPSPEEIARREYEMAEQRTAALVSQAPVAAQPAAVPKKQDKDEVILQKAKAKVNKKIVARMKQFIKDHPNQNNRELEKQIKKREQ